MSQHHLRSINKIIIEAKEISFSIIKHKILKKLNGNKEKKKRERPMLALEFNNLRTNGRQSNRIYNVLEK